jgi:hypothetical protein
MKNLKITFLLLLLSLISFAQVGIGTNTPVAGSILELKAADKALLLSRVANTAAVTTPVNGMMVYDISTNCIKGYQNGAWTNCLSACGNSSIIGGGDLGIDFTNTFKSMSYAGTGGVGALSSGGITPAGEVFLWGRWGGENTTVTSSTPFYAPLPAGEKGNRILIAKGYSTTGMAMVGTESGKLYFRGLETSSTTSTAGNVYGGIPLINVWTQVVVNGESTFIDFSIDKGSVNGGGTNNILIGTSGKAYRCGTGTTAAAPEKVTAYTQIPFPAGVTAYSRVWLSRAESSFLIAYLKGNNNKIYALGASTQHLLGNGSTTTVPFNATPVEVSFPTGSDIIDIQTNGFLSLALDANGKAYGWGRQIGITTTNYLFAANPIAANVSGSIITRPTELIRPSGTKFTKIVAGGDNYLFTVVYTDANEAYFKGSIDEYMLPDNIVNTLTISGFIDGADKLNYNYMSPIWSKFDKIYDTGKTVYATTASGKGYTWGKNYNSSGKGNNGTGYIFASIDYIFRPTPIATGIGDPLNSNPLY